MWFVFALVATLGWGCADLFYKKSTDENDPHSHLKIAVWVGIVMGVCALVLLPFAESGVGVLNIGNLVKYAPASLSYILSMVIGYAGMRYLEVSIISPVQNASGAMAAIVMAVWFAFTSSDPLGSLSDETGFIFGEVAGLELVSNILIAGGILIIVLGVMALAVAEHRLAHAENKALIAAGELDAKTHRKYRLGALALIFPLLYCLFDTVGTAADGIILDEETGLALGEIDILVLYGITFFVIGLGCWLYMLIRTKKPYNPLKNGWMAVAAGCEEFGQVFYVFAMAAKPVVAAPIIASYCIVSLLLGHVFLKERLKPAQYVCIAAVIVGIVALGIAEGIGEM